MVNAGPAQAEAGPRAGSGRALCATGLRVVLDERTVLQEIDLDLPAGQLTALLGANGAGKSTLLRALAGLVAYTGGVEIFGESCRRAGRLRVGLIAHQSMLYRDLTPRENLVFFGRLYGQGKPARRAEELLSLVGLSARADDRVRTLSRGMTQRVAIARALMHEPDLLLADEPFDGLDAPSTQALEGLLQQLCTQGRTILLANHDVHQSLRLAQRVLVLRKGRLVLDRPREAVTAADVLRELVQP